MAKKTCLPLCHKYQFKGGSHFEVGENSKGVSKVTEWRKKVCSVCEHSKVVKV